MKPIGTMPCFCAALRSRVRAWSRASSTTTATAPAGGGSAIQAPASVKSAGSLVFCSDISYPPEEFYKGSKPVGSDIDIGAEIAKRMGVKAQFDNTGFDGIIPALQ